MNVSELNENVQLIDLEKSIKTAILAIIDLKINNDMEKHELNMKAEFSNIKTQFRMLFWFIGILFTITTIILKFTN